MEKFQDKDGKEDRGSIAPMLKIGHNFRLTRKLGFSPQLGYIFNSNDSDDSYGGDYKIRTVFILYDVIYPVSNSVMIRFGLGNFIRSTKGDGGTVEVPNGGGTATSYRPSDSVKSYVGSINLGLDLRPSFLPYRNKLRKFGMRFEYHLISGFKSDKRTEYLTASFQRYF